MRTGILAVMLAAMSVTLWAGDGWLTDFEKAKEVAAKTERPILVDFSGSDWCGWCIRLDKEVFSQKEFKQFAGENLVLFLADFPRGKKQPEKVKEQNRELAKTYKIRGYPTVLLLDGKGKVLLQTGYREGGAAAYIEHLKNAMPKPSAVIPVKPPENP